MAAFVGQENVGLYLDARRLANAVFIGQIGIDNLPRLSVNFERDVAHGIDGADDFWRYSRAETIRQEYTGNRDDGSVNRLDYAFLYILLELLRFVLYHRAEPQNDRIRLSTPRLSQLGIRDPVGTCSGTYDNAFHPGIRILNEKIRSFVLPII